MYKRDEINTAVTGLYNALTENFNEFITNRAVAVEGIETKDVDSAFEVLSGINAAAESLAKATFFEGLGASQFVANFKGNESDGKLHSVELTIRSSRNSDYKYRSSKVIAVNAEVLDNICETYRQTVIDLVYGAYAVANVSELNEIVTGIADESGASVRFSFTVGDNYIMAINNTEVVFGVSVQAAIELSERASSILFKGEGEDVDSFQKAVVESTRVELANFLKTVPSVPSLINDKPALVASVTGVKLTRRVDKYIRYIVHKQAKYLADSKSGVGYFCESVEVGGEQITVFALVEKVDSGEMAVILNPFNVETCLDVDFDVLAAIQ